MIGPSSQRWQPMLAIDIGPRIDRGLDDNCGPILARYIGPKIAPDCRPRITARVKPTNFNIYNVINNDNKIWLLAYYWYWIIEKKVFCHIVQRTRTRDLPVCYLST